MKSRTFHNILIIKPSSLGDVVRAVPIFNSLRSRYPQARISWLIRPDCAGILQNLMGLDEILEFDRKRFSRIGRSFGVTRDFICFLKHLRQKKFDLVLDLQGLFRSGFISWQTKAQVRIGLADARELAPIFYTHKVPVCPGEHIVDSLWHVSEELGLGDDKKVFQLTIDPDAQKSARELLTQLGLPSGQNYVALLIGGTEAAKRWPTKRFAQLADCLRDRYNLSSVLLGAGQVEETLAQEIVQSSQSKIINLVGQTCLQQLLAILDSSRLVVGNDSGPLHLAAALEVDLISLYGPTNPAVVGPFGHLDSVIEAGKGVSRQGRYSKKPAHRIEAITLEEVTVAIDHKLAR